MTSTVRLLRRTQQNSQWIEGLYKRRMPGVRETSATTLVMHGATDDAAAARQTALKGWLTHKHKAEDHLIPWLKRLSYETGLSYSSVSIRQQQTRWGSCSPRRLIQSQRTAIVFAARVGYLRAA